MVRFTVIGQPRPKGSMKAFVPKGWDRAVLTSSNPSVKEWEQTIRLVAQEFSEAFTTGPVRVGLRFALPRPKSLSTKSSRLHTKRPDIDKLSRAVLDALTNVLWADDSQVFSLTARKVYALPSQPPKVDITITSL